MLTLGPGAIATLTACRQSRQSMPEAGGILLGRLIESSPDIVIDAATPPHPEDRESRFSFFRRKEPAQHRVNIAWMASGGTSIYLGEWHSHPEDDPHPSGQDLSNWKRILRYVKCEHDALFFLIVGRHHSRAWEGSRDSGAITALANFSR